MAVLTTALSAPIRVLAEETEVVSYENLKDLLKEGNVSLKASYDSYNDNVKAYEEMRDTLKWQQLNLEGKAEELKDSDSEISSVYSSNAASLKRSSSQLTKQIKTMTEEKSTKSLEKSADAMTMTAQTLMNSYNQMLCNIEAREKSVEAQRASCFAVTTRHGIGSATEAEVLSAQKSLAASENSLNSLKENAAQLREQLLALLGIRDSAAVVIGIIPEPDLTAIDAINFAEDQQKAVNNSSSVQNERHARAGSTAEKKQKSQKVETAESEAAASIEAVYQTLLQKRTEYQAALEAFESASISYQSLQKKQEAGMLSNTQYLQGEASYLEKKAAKEIAGMTLYQAYETYRWEIYGV
ncbi:TolC family protein [Clostridium sp. MCC353]|nr:TolC family protein [Clostridium sp. MCC353]MBT9777534.1 TolC family protein [Clostridium sp. MCC353]